MPVDEGQPEGEGLGQAYECVIDCAIAVGMEPAHDFTDNTRAFDVATVRPKAHLIHLVDNPALYGLQAVTGIRQRARVDHRIGVLQERAAHFVIDIDVDDALTGGLIARARHAVDPSLRR